MNCSGESSLEFRTILLIYEPQLSIKINFSPQPTKQVKDPQNYLIYVSFITLELIATITVLELKFELNSTLKSSL